jgi:hypothetical protein
MIHDLPQDFLNCMMLLPHLIESFSEGNSHYKPFLQATFLLHIKFVVGVMHLLPLEKGNPLCSSILPADSPDRAAASGQLQVSIPVY